MSELWRKQIKDVLIRAVSNETSWSYDLRMEVIKEIMGIKE